MLDKILCLRLTTFEHLRTSFSLQLVHIIRGFIFFHKQQNILLAMTAISIELFPSVFFTTFEHPILPLSLGKGYEYNINKQFHKRFATSKHLLQFRWVVKTLLEHLLKKRFCTKFFNIHDQHYSPHYSVARTPFRSMPNYTLLKTWRCKQNVSVPSNT